MWLGMIAADRLEGVMNRRGFLSGAAVTPLAGALAGCVSVDARGGAITRVSAASDNLPPSRLVLITVGASNAKSVKNVPVGGRQ